VTSTIAPAVTFGGVPAGARWHREVSVLRGIAQGRPSPTYRPPRRKDGTPDTSAPRPASRTALTDEIARRCDDRVLHIYELEGEWHVLLLDVAAPGSCMPPETLVSRISRRLAGLRPRLGANSGSSQPSTPTGGSSREQPEDTRHVA
jgi:hypothetical protein